MDPVLRRFRHYFPLDAEDAKALTAAVVRARHVAAGERIVHEGERPDHVNLVLSGFIARVKTVPEGHNQITSLYLDGDVFDLRMYVLRQMDHTLTAISPARIGYIPRDQLLRLADQRPNLQRAFWAAALVNESILAEWLVNIGRRRGPERLAHLICEIFWRLRAVGRLQGADFALPFRQGEIAEMLAFSPVHVSRAVGRLRREGLVAESGPGLVVRDLAGLQRFAGFDPAYLHLSNDA
jgi:CRP-like cAMP-binding protein